MDGFFCDITDTRLSHDSFPNLKSTYDNNSSLRLEVSHDLGNGYWEIARLNSDLMVFMSTGMYYSGYDQLIMPVQNFLTFRFVISGSASSTFDKFGKPVILEGNTSVIHTRKNQSYYFSVNSDVRLCYVTIHIRPGLLRTRFGTDDIELFSKLTDASDRDGAGEYLYGASLSPGILGDVYDLTNMPYTGIRRRLYTEAKTTALMCRLLQEIKDEQSSDPRMQSFDSTINQKIFEVQRFLTENYVHPPTIVQLAQQFGLNRTTLSAAFKQTVGKTVSEYCLDFRMQKARELLNDPDLSVSEVAYAMGYDYPTNFTSAFKKYYGFRPKEIHRSTLV